MQEGEHLTFESTRFAVEPGEDEETNPGIYGKALAHWVADGLRERGVDVDRVVPEDWGWCVVVSTEPLRLNVACSNVDGSESSWRIFGFAERGALQWLRRSGDPDAAVADLQGHLEALVRSLADGAHV